MRVDQVRIAQSPLERSEVFGQEPWPSTTTTCSPPLTRALTAVPVVLASSVLVCSIAFLVKLPPRALCTPVGVVEARTAVPRWIESNMMVRSHLSEQDREGAMPLLIPL